MELSYFRIRKFLWRWAKEDGARLMRDVALSLDRPPPLLEEPKPPRAPIPKQPRPKPQAGDGLLQMMGLYERFQTWLETPDPPKPPKPAKPVKDEKAVPQFDIQDIPAAMRKTHLPMSAKLMERWFAGRLNYSPTTDDEKAEINQDGERYPPDMYDTKTVKLDWVLRFPRAKERYDHLINNAIRSDAALKELSKKLREYKGEVVDLDAANICEGDIVKLHRHFHFQHEKIDSTFAQRIMTALKNTEDRFAPDDLSGALGSFVFYAAIGYVSFKWNGRRKEAEVHGIWVYVKDNFTFTDGHGDRSQYLGHWSRDGVIVVPYDYVAATSRYIPHIKSSVTVPYVNAPVSIGDPLIKGNVYHPIHNSDFRQWAIKHRRGGDFIVYSDRRYIPIFPPIKVDL